MVSKHTVAIAMVVCAVATGGVAAGVYGAAGVGADDADSPSTDRSGTEHLAASELRAQQDDATRIESGETVTGTISAETSTVEYVFDIESGERATITYTLHAPAKNDTGLFVYMPSGRQIPEGRLAGAVEGGETKTLTVLANESGTARIVIGVADPLRPWDGGEFELSLSIDQPGEVDDATRIESGETVTADLENRSSYVFDIEPGETATIEYTWEAAEDSEESNTGIEVQVPDGRTIPKETASEGLIVRSGDTVTFNVTTKKAGQAKIRINTDIAHAASEAQGTFELSLSIEQTGEVPDEPNDDRANATELEFNATKSAELDGAEVDYYTFTLPDYRTPDYPHVVNVPVTVTVERERQGGVSVLNVGTTTRYVGTSNPASVQFVGTEGSQYYVAVANVNEGGGPYNLTVQLDESDVSGEPVAPDNGTQSLDEISQAAYGIPFEELSEPTSHLVQAVYDHQDSETKLSKDELARMRYDMAFEELSEETRGEITTLYRAQFAGGQNG